MWRIIKLFGYKVCAKIYDEPSVYGIYGGRISKLSIWKKGREILSYERGWDFSELSEATVKKIVNVLEWIF